MKSSIDVRALARVGAEQRISALQHELAALLKAFPELQRAGRDRGATAARAETPRVRRGRRQMSAAERAAVSARMRKYWAARRRGAVGSKGRAAASADASTAQPARAGKAAKGRANKRTAKTA